MVAGNYSCDFLNLKTVIQHVLRRQDLVDGWN